jgi:hypothetical protein
MSAIIDARKSTALSRRENTRSTVLQAAKRLLFGTAEPKPRNPLLEAAFPINPLHEFTTEKSDASRRPAETDTPSRRVSEWAKTQALKVLDPPEASIRMSDSKMPIVASALVGQGNHPAVVMLNTPSMKINTAWREKVLKPTSDALLQLTGRSLRREQLMLRLGSTRNGMANALLSVQARKDVALSHVEELRGESMKILARKLEKKSDSLTPAQRELIPKLKDGTASIEEVFTNFRENITDDVTSFQEQIQHADNRLEAFYHTLLKSTDNEIKLGEDQAARRTAHLQVTNAAAWIGLGFALNAGISAATGTAVTPEGLTALCFAAKGIISYSANKYRQHSNQNQEKSGFYTTPTDTESHDWVKFIAISAMMIALREAMNSGKEDESSSKDDTAIKPETKNNILTLAYLAFSISKGTHLFARIAYSTGLKTAHDHKEDISDSVASTATTVAASLTKEAKEESSISASDIMLTLE